jgi:ABC-2 type transport system ATP-binding protein
MAATIPVQLGSEASAARTYDLTKRYGSTDAVRGVSLTVPEGSFYLLVGPNGAGKTTTLRMLLGLLRPTSGHAEIRGVRSGPDGAARARVGIVPETQDGPYSGLKVRQLISHHAAYFPLWDHDYARRLVATMEIRLDAAYGKLSKGQARRVQLLLALAHRPAVLLLDEPTDGLDPVARDTVQGVLADHIAATPTTVLAATHLVYEMERFADHVGVLREGRLTAQVTCAELHARLRRYVLDVPEGWQPGSAEKSLAVLRQNGSPREQRWTVWGDERVVTEQLEECGARVRAVSGLSLEEAALALLSGKDLPHD